LLAPLPAQNWRIDACGASLGNNLQLDLALGAPNAVYLLFFSGDAGPTLLRWVDANDPRELAVGLDLLPLLQVGSLDGQGGTRIVLPLPRDASLAGVRLHSQGILYPGRQYLFGDLSNPITFELDQPAQWRDRFRPIKEGRAYAVPIAKSDGTFLIPGGGNGALLALIGHRTSEVYDPQSSAWITGPTMSTERAAHTVTRMLDGRSLLVGGVNFSNDPQDSAEIYDPVPDQFVPAAKPASKRMGHTATLLPTGHVLVTGGLSDLNGGTQAITSALKSTEIYDPAANTWRSGPDMAFPRAGHSAHLLPSGKVLLLGGVSWTTLIIKIPRFLREVEIYDPFANTMTRAADMFVDRALHASTVLADGRILVSGGSNNILAGGVSIQSVEAYDPTQNKWTALPAMAQARGFHGAVRQPDGTVLVMGGAQGSLLTPVSINLCEIYDPVANAWRAAPTMQKERAAFPLLELQGCVYYAVSGGGAQALVIKDTEYYFR
jgi:N-acetylneuraminic acid mutarotase